MQESQIAQKSPADASQEALLKEIIGVRDANQARLSTKYDAEYIRQIIQRDLVTFEKIFADFITQNRCDPSKGMGVVDFIFLFITKLDMPPYETLFLITAIMDFFECVILKDDNHEKREERRDIQYFIQFEDITLYLCENHPFNDDVLPPGIKIPTRILPLPKIFNNSMTERRVRDIDVFAPIIYRDTNETIARLNKDMLHIDSVHHNNGMIMKSQYAFEIGRVIVLDQYSDVFIIYTDDCKMESTFRPSSQHLRGQVCIDFFWSERQFRVGTVFRDNYLAFWDYGDNFSFEKSFHVGEKIIEEQVRIWYISVIDSWMTTDNHLCLNVWDLEKEKVSGSIKSEYFKNGIINIVEVSYLSAIVVGSSDNIVTVWDIIGKKILFKVNVTHEHLNGISYFKTYQVILTIGYDNQIGIYQLNPAYNDSNKLGELTGHISIVTAVRPVENTPMIVSSDDKYNVKVWDIRSTNCIQSIDLDLRNAIKQILATPERVFFLSSRLTSVKFDSSSLLQSPSETNKINEQFQQQAMGALSPTPPEGLVPLGATMNLKNRELIIATTKDIRFVNLNNGKIHKIIHVLTDNKDDQITAFQVMDSNQRILLGTLKGMLHIHDLKTGELLSELPVHTNEVTNIRMDYLNKLLFTTSSDSSIAIQKITSTLESQKFRSVLNSNPGQEVILAEINVHHNIFVTSYGDNQLLIWSYEFGKLLATFELEFDQEPTAISILSGYSIIVVATTKGYIYFIKFTQGDDLDLQLIANINLVKSLILRAETLQKVVAEEVKRAYQFQELQTRKVIETTKKLQRSEIQKEQIEEKNKTSKKNYEAKAKENELKKEQEKINLELEKAVEELSFIKEQKIDTTGLYTQQEQQVPGDDNELFLLPDPESQGKDQNEEGNNENDEDQMKQPLIKKDSLIFATKIVIDIIMPQDKRINFEQPISSSALLPEAGTLIVGLNNGEIRKYDISTIFKIQNIKFTPHCKTKMNYNAFRQSFEDHSLGESNYKIQCFKQHKSRIVKDVAVINSMSKTKLTQKFQDSVTKIQQIRGFVPNLEEGERAFDQYFNQSSNMVDLVCGHKGELTSVEFLRVHTRSNELVLTTATDCFIKIWSFLGYISLLASLNITHPLPIYWNLQINNDDIYAGKLLLAIKSQDAVIEKYKEKMSFQQYQKFNFQNLLSFIKNQRQQQKLNNNSITGAKASLTFLTAQQEEDDSENNRISQQKKNQMSSMPRKTSKFTNNPQTESEKVTLTDKTRLNSKTLAQPPPLQSDVSLKKNSSSKPLQNQQQEQPQINKETKKKRNSQTISKSLQFNKDTLKKDLKNPDNDEESQEENQIQEKEDQISNKDDQFKESQLQEDENKIELMKDEFTPRDLLFGKIKHLYQQEIAGPSLRHLQQTKRIAISKQEQEVHINKEAHKPEEYKEQIQSEEKNKEQKYLAAFFNPDYRRNFLEARSGGGGDNLFFEKPVEMLILNKKLDTVIQQHRYASEQSIAPRTPMSSANIKKQQQQLAFPINLQKSSLNPQKQLKTCDTTLASGFQQQVQQQVSIMQSSILNQVKMKQQQRGSSLQVSRNQSLMLSKRDSQAEGTNIDNDSSSSKGGRLGSTGKLLGQDNSARGAIGGGIGTNQESCMSIPEVFSLKKDAEEIFNFKKKVPSSTTEHYKTGGEFLVKINYLERNHGLKFKLFETHKHSINNKSEYDSKWTQQQSTSQHIRAGSLSKLNSRTQASLHNHQMGTSRDFLDYAQQRAVMSTNMQNVYNKQISTLTPAQVKNYFLSEIEDEKERQTFNEKFIHTMAQNSLSMAPHIAAGKTILPQKSRVYANTNRQSGMDFISGDRSPDMNQKIVQMGLKNPEKIRSIPNIPKLSLPNSTNNSQQNEQISTFHSQRKLETNEVSSSNNETSIQDLKKIFQVNSQNSFNKTQKRCFHDVVKNLNFKLAKHRINPPINSNSIEVNQPNSQPARKTRFAEQTRDYRQLSGRQYTQGDQNFESGYSVNYYSTNSDIKKDNINNLKSKPDSFFSQIKNKISVNKSNKLHYIPNQQEQVYSQAKQESDQNSF